MECRECGYATTRMEHFKRHLKSNKHLAITGHVCVCGNVYAAKQSLRRHEKTCTYGQPSIQSIVVHLAQDHVRMAREQAERDARLAREQAERDARHSAEIERLLTELAARPSVVMTNCSFNLSVFLNEQCKNAPNIEEFMKQIPLHMDSTIEMGQYFLDNLAKCAVEERPIHCTDVKRGKLAVKHGEMWEQDKTKTDPIIAHNLNLLRGRFIKHLTEVWCVENPKCTEDGPLCDEYDRLYAMTCKDVDDKFHRHLAKATLIPKE